MIALIYFQTGPKLEWPPAKESAMGQLHNIVASHLKSILRKLHYLITL